MLEKRPWGTFQILLEDQKCKVKKIIVQPGHKLSLQSHKKRNELWKIISGTGLITLNSITSIAIKDMVYEIPYNTIHRIENNGFEELIFIEIQTGDYFGEDDIIRYEDSYGRV